MGDRLMPDVEAYLNLPYTVVLCRNEQAEYVARLDELAGLSARGRTSQEALENLEAAKKVWIADCLGRGDPIPPPRTKERSAEESPTGKELPSGKWV